MAKIDSRTITKDYGWGRNRTADTWIFSPLLCQLSYPAVANADVASASRGLSLKQKTGSTQRSDFSERLRCAPLKMTVRICVAVRQQRARDADNGSAKSRCRQT